MHVLILTIFNFPSPRQRFRHSFDVHFNYLPLKPPDFKSPKKLFD